MNTIPKSISATLSEEEVGQIRLERVIQQRKRMEYMSSLIIQQKDSITLLKQQNHDLSESYCDIKLQNQLLKDKLNVSDKHNANNSQVLVKQSSLLQSFRQLLLGTNLLISQQQRQILLEQIQILSQKWQKLNHLQGPNANIGFNYAQKSSTYYGFDKQAALQIARLTDQNQQLNQKYQQLCSNYLQLSKDIKLKQLQISNLTNGHNSLSKNNINDLSNHHNCGHIRNKKAHTPSKSHKKSSQIYPDETFFKRIIKDKDSQIISLHQRIEQLKIQQQKKDELIKQHRKNQKQQKRLLHFLKNKFNVQGKQLSQIASHNRIKSTIHLDASPSKPSIYSQVDNSNIQSLTKKKTQKSPFKQLLNVKEKNCNYGLTNVLQNKNSVLQQKLDLYQKINEPNSSGFKRTQLKNLNNL